MSARRACGLLLGLATFGTAAIFAQGPPQPAGEIRRFLGHTQQVNSVAFVADAKRIVSSSIDSSVRLWDTATGKEIRRHVDHSEIVWRVVVSPDGNRVLSGGGGTYDTKVDRFKSGKDNIVRLWTSDSLKELQRFKGHTDSVRGLAFSLDGKQALSASLDGTIRFWEMDSGKQLRSLRLPTGSSALALSPDGKKFVAASSVRPIVLSLWDLESGKELRAFRGHSLVVTGLVFSTDGKRILSGSMDGTVRLWDVDTGKQLRILRHPSGVTNVAFFPDGRHVISASGAQLKPGSATRYISAPGDWFVRVWDLETKAEVIRLAGHVRAVTDVRLSPDGRQAVSCGTDKTVRLWALPALPLEKTR
jgi:WD40 repeat protein